MWCVLATMTTVGYGDYYPTTFIGKVFMCCVAFTGQTFIIGLPIAIIGLDFQNTYALEEEKEKYDVIDIENEDKYKQLNLIKNRLLKLAERNKIIRELTIKSSKMSYIITKDLGTI